MSSVSLYDEVSLLALVSKGDENAFRNLFDRYKDKIYFIAYKITQEATSAEDVVQEIFIKLWLHRQKLPELESFAAYLHTITRNHIFSQLRKLATEEVYFRQLKNQSHPELHSPDPVLYNELKKMFEIAVARLPPQQKKVYQLGKLEGKKYEEIASLLNISRETVKEHMAKASASVKRYMGPTETLGALIVILIRSL